MAEGRSWEWMSGKGEGLDEVGAGSVEVGKERRGVEFGVGKKSRASRRNDNARRGLEVGVGKLGNGVKRRRGGRRGQAGGLEVGSGDWKAGLQNGSGKRRGARAGQRRGEEQSGGGECAPGNWAGELCEDRGDWQGGGGRSRAGTVRGNAEIVLKYGVNGFV